MPVETYYVGAYWGPRQETAAACAQRLSRSLQGLGATHRAFAQWYMTGETQEEARTPINAADQASLEKLLLSGQNKKDRSQAPIEALGFSASLWAPGDGEDKGSRLHVTCGSYARKPGVNAVVLNLPADGAVSEHVLQEPLLRAVVGALVEAWAPDWAVVMSNAYQKTLTFPRGNAPRVGWMLYLSAARGQIPPLPQPAQASPLGSQGHLIVLTPHRFSASNPGDVGIAQQTAAVLSQAGVLGPLR